MDKTEAAVQLFNKRAKEYQEKFMDTALYQQTFDLFCEAIPEPGARILELACGPGNITKYLLSRRPDLRLLATDLAPNMLELARANNPTAGFTLMDCRHLNTLTEKFDGIMCGFALPYLSKGEAVQLITDAAKVLSPGGVLYISTMEGDYDMSGIQTNSYGEQLYMHYHEAEYLVEALEASRFTNINVQRINCPQDNGVLSTDLVIIATQKN